MNKLLLGGVGAAAMFAIGPAIAQPAPPPPPGVAPAPQVQIMRMPMKTQTRDDVVRHVRELFARLDTNRDGYLTREESDAATKLMAGEIKEKFARRLADRGDMGPGDHPGGNVFYKRFDGDADRGAAFDRLDANHDGVITRDEFVAVRPEIKERRVFVMREGGPEGAMGEAHEFHMRHMGGMAMMHGRMFEMSDANHDGRVSLQEATDAALRHFDMADANHDGKITPDERMQIRKTIRIERRQPA
jgi:Ca2+-binding EF-hand superfamily protein